MRAAGPHALRAASLCALLGFAQGGLAQTYTSASTAYNFIDPASHTKIGANTAPYKFNTAADCGTAPPVLDDTISNAIPIGFTFRYGATDYTSVQVMSNGRLQFGNTTCGYGTTNIGPPQTYPYAYPDAAMNNTMKVFGVDLDPTNLVDQPNYPSSSQRTPCASIASCYVSVATIGSAPARQFVVTWKNVPEWVSTANTSGSFDLQIILNEDGSFVYQYGSNRHGGTGVAQIGWQLSTSDYQVLSFGASQEPPANTAIAFYIPAPVAAYRLDEGAWAPGLAGQLTDSAGAGRHGMAIGAAQSDAGGKLCRGAAIPLNTSAAQVDALQLGASLSNTSLNLRGSGSIAFWYRANRAWAGGTPGQLIDATTVDGQWFSLTRTASGTLYFAVRDSTGALRSVETPAQAVAAGTWVHVAATWSFNGLPGSNQDSLRVFVNDTPTASSFTSDGTVATSVGTITIGDNPSGSTAPNGSVNSADGEIDEVNVYNYALSTSQVGVLMAATRSCVTPVLHHLVLQHASGSGLTCTPSTLTIRACADAACATPYSGGVSGRLTAAGSSTVNFDGSTGYGSGAGFVVPYGAATVSKDVQLTTPGSTLLGTADLNIAASAATACNFGSPACTFTAADSGFTLAVPNHAAESTQTLTITAVRKDDASARCVPAFANTTKTVTLSCSYANPASGTQAVRVGVRALNAAGNAGAACDATGAAVAIAFDAGGVGRPTLQYADVGQLTLQARHVGTSGNVDAGLVMTGSTQFVSAPASFGFSAITAAPIRAGTAFAATVTARNSAGAATPNFGRELAPERATLAFTRRAPTGAGASNGVFSGSLGAFAAGIATSTDLVWSEVGSGDLSATLASGNYLGSGLTATGSTGAAGAVGRFIPHHFDVALTPACGVFSYAGQPFAVTLTAKNGLASPGTTLNYDGSAATTPTHAKAVTLTDQPALALGTLSGGSVAAGAFTAGVASAAPAYAFTAKTTAPQALVLRATDADGVSSAGHAEGSTLLRSGRLRVASAFGSEKSALALPVRAEYWSGQSWLTNGDDSCTTVSAAAVALSNRRSHLGNATSAWSNTVSSITLAAGLGTLTLGAPSPAASGTVDVALNLGSASADQSCLAAHPATGGAARAWLRAANGSCAATADRDPSARATFGIHSPETQRTIHARELF